MWMDRWPDSSHYGSVDAALWYARAVHLWRAPGGSDALYRDVLGPALLEIASGYAEGKGAAGRLGLRARPDGLLTAGRPDLNATWMDAQLPEGPVTPRDGMPVEIEALWTALLDQCVALRPSDARLRAMRDRSFEAFVALFWIPGSHGGPGRLADRIDADGQQDRRIRPNRPTRDLQSTVVGSGASPATERTPAPPCTGCERCATETERATSDEPASP